MAAEVSAALNEKQSKFQELFEEACQEILLDFKAISFGPIHIKNCNGTGNWAFCEATIDYEKKPAFWAHLWYANEYQAIGEQLHGNRVFKNEAFECLLDCVLSDKHLKCLKFLLSTRGSEKRDEKTVKSILALHYFAPLVHNCTYQVDNAVKCKCGVTPKKDKTSFGIKGFWHGEADIVVNESVVKVVKKPSSLSEGEDEEVIVETLGSGEPSQVNVESIVEVKLFQTIKRKAKSQAMAQAIVNAFYQAKVDKSQSNKYIPSFLATETCIRIILFNTEADTLLLSEKYQIWDENEKGEPILNVQTLIQVWLTLNCQKMDENIPQFIRERTPCSDFRKIVGESVYSIYKTKVTRPLEDKEYDSKHAKSALDLEGYNKATKCSTELFESIMRYKKKRFSTENATEIPAKI